MKHIHPKNKRTFTFGKSGLPTLIASALLSTLAACGGSGDDEEAPAPRPAPAAVAPAPVVIAVIPSASVTGAGSDSPRNPGTITSGVTDDDTPTLYGAISETLTSGQKVNVYDGDVLFPEVAVVFLGKSWSFTPSAPLSAGTHNFTVAVAQADGKLGPVSAPYVLSVQPPPIPPSISGITPATATAGVLTTFTVSGKKLPLTAVMVVGVTPCQTPTQRSETGFTTVCDPGNVAGNPMVLIYTDTLANNGIPIGGMQTITVSTETAPGTTPVTTPTTTPPPTTPETTPAATPTVAMLLTDTGITSAQCYKAGSDTLVSCTSAEAIALNDKQDGMLGRDVTNPDSSDGKLGFSYSAVGSYDKTECVKDNITGLTWEGKPSSGLRAINNTYTNYGDSRNGDAGAYVTAVNATGLCGHTDWRLPTRDELYSLVDYGASMPGVTIDSNWVPAATGNEVYWTSDSNTTNPNFAWFVLFYFGSSVTVDRGSASYVRLVR